MKRYNQYNHKVIGLALAALTFAACSDTWDDHYDAAVVGVNEGTLWQAINRDGNLSNFARVVKDCGYEAALNSSQVFTVFAPTNDHFTSAQADSVVALYKQEVADHVKDEDNRAIKEFLQNHIALYNHSVSSLSNDSIVMMNGKYMMLTPTTFGGRTIAKGNVLQENGVLFTLTDKVNYFPNVFEYLRSGEGLDSIANFLYGYNEYEFLPGQSVPGGIVDGQTVYLDSVSELKNDIFDCIGKINSEDSTYWMVVPTNEVWKSLIDEYSEYFNYDNTVSKADSLKYIHSRLAIVEGTVFSRTNNSDQALQDSAFSTNAVRYNFRQSYYGSSDLAYYQYYKPYATGGVFTGVEDVACSNGKVMRTTDWKIKRTQTFMQDIIVEAENTNRLDSIDEKTTRSYTTERVDVNNPFYDVVSNHSYAVLAPITSTVHPRAWFNIPNVLSNVGYDIYVVVAPALAADTTASATQRLPNNLRFELNYHDVDGKVKNMKLPEGKTTDFPTRPDVVDTLLVGSNIVIPTCTFVPKSSVLSLTPQVSLSIQSYVKASERDKVYTKTARIDCIILKPHEE